MNPSQPENVTAPMVSVVMCSFNPPAGYFREAIESVRQQVYPAWELLVVDNGTTNGSDAVAREYAESCDRVRFLQHPGGVNKGPAASRNLGMQEAGGELIAFLDADDVWLPDKLAQQVEAMLSHPAAALSFGGILRWYDGMDGRADGVEEHVPVLEVLPPGALVDRLLHNVCIPGMSALMVRAAEARAVGGFEESLLWAEDQTISYKLGLHHACLVLPGWKVKYRQHAESTTTGVVSEGRLFADHLRFLDWVAGYFEAAGVVDPALRGQLRRLQRQYGWCAFKERWVPAGLRRALKRWLGKS